MSFTIKTTADYAPAPPPQLVTSPAVAVPPPAVPSVPDLPPPNPGLTEEQVIALIEARVGQMGMPIATNVANFDGINDELTANFAAAALPNAFTFTCWFKMRVATGSHALFSTNNSGAGADQVVLWAQLNTGAGRMGSGRFNAAGALQTTWAGNADIYFDAFQWTHVALIARRLPTVNVEVWVNGQRYGNIYAGAFGPTNYGSVIGIGRAFGFSFFNGQISNATLHSRELTRDELLGLSRRGRAFSVPTSNLVGWWPMDAALTTDASGNGNTLTALGGMTTNPMN